MLIESLSFPEREKELELAVLSVTYSKVKKMRQYQKKVRRYQITRPIEMNIMHLFENMEKLSLTDL